MPTSPRMSQPRICASFRQLARRIWRDLSDATSAALQRDEETITNDLLLGLWRQHPSDVTIVQFNKRQESRTGADWLWALTDGANWLLMLVQAKRLYPQTDRYEQLARQVGAPPRDQIDILLNTANHLRAWPVYFFYNFTTSRPLPILWNCQSFPLTDQLFGCSVAEATAVKSTIASAGDTLSAISRVSFPLHCLVCCPGRGNSLPTRANGILRDSKQLAVTETDPSGTDSLSTSQPWWAGRILGAPSEERRFVAQLISRDLPESLNGLVIVKERSA
jgi:hypothetical protein